jgi:hypothetical protein
VRLPIALSGAPLSHHRRLCIPTLAERGGYAAMIITAARRRSVLDRAIKVQLADLDELESGHWCWDFVRSSTAFEADRRPQHRRRQ